MVSLPQTLPRTIFTKLTLSPSQPLKSKTLTQLTLSPTQPLTSTPLTLLTLSTTSPYQAHLSPSSHCHPAQTVTHSAPNKHTSRLAHTVNHFAPTKHTCHPAHTVTQLTLSPTQPLTSTPLTQLTLSTTSPLPSTSLTQLTLSPTQRLTSTTLTQLTVSLPQLQETQRKPRFDPRPVHAGTLLDKLALGQVYLPVPYKFIHHRRSMTLAKDIILIKTFSLCPTNQQY